MRQKGKITTMLDKNYSSLDLLRVGIEHNPTGLEDSSQLEGLGSTQMISLNRWRMLQGKHNLEKVKRKWEKHKKTCKICLKGSENKLSRKLNRQRGGMKKIKRNLTGNIKMLNAKISKNNIVLMVKAIKALEESKDFSITYIRLLIRQEKTLRKLNYWWST